MHEPTPSFDQLTEYIYQESIVESKGVVTVKVAKALVTNKDDGKKTVTEQLLVTGTVTPPRNIPVVA